MPNWYVDPANATGCAANSNSCTSATCGGVGSGIGPCVIVQEIVSHRWGTTQPILAQTTTINVLSSETLGQESVVLQRIGVKGSSLVIDGSAGLTQVASFSLGTITPKSRVGAGSPLKSTGFVAGGLAVSQLVVNQVTGGHSFIQAISGGTATLAQPLAHLPPSYQPKPAEDDGWATGQQVKVFTVPRLNLEVLAPLGSGDTTDEVTNGETWVNAIYVPDNGGLGQSFFAVQLAGNIVGFQDCAFDPFVTSQDGNFTHGSGFFVNCAFNTGAELNNMAVQGGYTNTYPLTLDTEANVDLDHIASAGWDPEGNVCFVGYLYVPAGVPTIWLYPGTNLVIDDDLSGTPGACLYGGAALTVGASAALLQRSGSTWSAHFQLTGTLSLMDTTGPLTTGTSYASGTWTDGRAINTTNLDTYGALVNPKTGARMSIAIGP